MRTDKLARCCAMVLATLLAGCVSVPQARESFGDTALRFNREVEDAYNRTMFLNVIRASHRTPMYFTSITELTRADVDKRTLAMVLPFGGGRNELLRTATGGLERSSSPLFKMAVQDSANFYRGILSPLNLVEVSNFISIGFPPEYVGILTIERIEYASGTTLENDHRNIAPFVGALQEILRACEFSAPMSDESDEEAPGTEAARVPLRGIFFAAPEGVPEARDNACPGGRLVTRSAEGVIYYVGQIVRDQSPVTFTPTGSSDAYVVFAGRKGAVVEMETARLAVEYAQELYVVPEPSGDPIDLSMTTLNFLNYVIGLHKESPQLQTVDAITLTPR